MLSLQEIGLKHNTDKATLHNYCDFYARYFDAIRDGSVRLLEIGVWKSYSMKMWLEYFKNGEIHGIDYIDNTVPAGSYFHKVNCENEDSLTSFSEECGEFDIIIDDGGHTMKQQQLAFKHLFDKARRYYVIEDLHTSFMPRLRNCNMENWPTTFDMIRALSGEISFESPGITTDFIQNAKTNIASVDVFVKTQGTYSSSVTCVITKP